MKMTMALKGWLVEHKGVAKDADDDTFRKAATEALLDGSLTAEKLAELTADKQNEEANEVVAKLNTIVDTLARLAEAQAEKTPEKKTEPMVKVEKKVEPETKTVVPSLPEDFTKAIGEIGASQGSAAAPPRVKGAHERYSTTKGVRIYPNETKTGRRHPMAGEPMRRFSDDTREMETASELDKAAIGSFCKFLCQKARLGGSRTFAFQTLPEHDKELLQYAMENFHWGGASDGGDYSDIKDRALTPRERKELIDDAGSGGLEAAPIVFDDQVIAAPLLNGELYPLVTVVPLDRGRRIEGVVLGQVTGTWGGVDATAIPLFNTTAFVTAFNTTVYRWEGSIRIGLDFLSDTPIDFGQAVTQQYGEQLLNDLDDVIAVGNGTTQPEGVMIKAGVTAVAFGGTDTIGAYETLRFGVTKQEHAGRAASAVFCGTETSYRRARALAVGAADNRRLGGMDYSSYKWMEHDFKLNSSLTNAQIFYAIMSRYRMYQRRGLTITTSREGSTLITRNELLMVATARYGGQLERAACAARTTTAG